MSAYAWVHIIHLFCAVAFAGGVIFEALVLSALHSGKVSRPARQEAEAALSQRAVRVMPFVVALLFASGISMAVLRYLPALSQPAAAPFNLQLTLKISLAGCVLLHFLVAVVKMRRGTLTRAWSRYIHAAVLCQIITIVFLSKSMFYLAG